MLVAALVVTLAAACSAGEDDEPSAGPTATEASPTPEPSTTPVSGEVNVEYKTITNVALFNDGDPNAVDPPDDVPAIEGLVSGTTAWLDGHLTSLQNGGGGTLAEVADPALLEGADPALLDAVTSQLASPDTPVASARYDYLVTTVAGPKWLRATVTVEHPGGSTSTAQLVLVPGEQGPKLVAAGPGVSTDGGEG